MLLVLLIVLGLVASPAVAGPLDVPGYDKAFTCSACHGFAGNSRAPTIPILAGMAAPYLEKALQDYATGRRPSTEMEPYAKMAVQLGVGEVAAYFAAQRRERTPVGLDSAAVSRGQTAAVQCAACHGADGRGDAAKAIPDLRGQPEAYLLSQMLLFKTERRSPGDAALTSMKAVMKTISDGTMADLAAYFASRR